MFRRLREKIAEEVKQTPKRFPAFSAQNETEESQTSVSGSKNDLINFGETNGPVSLQENVATSSRLPQPTPDQFSIADDDNLSSGESSPRKEMAETSGEPSTFGSPLSNSANPKLDGDVAILPMYLPPERPLYSPQSDIESEVEDPNAINLNAVTKEQLYNAFQKTRSRVQKYKAKYSEVVKAYRDLDSEKEKIKRILTESQDKALRRISELREQSLLEQQAKAHLEENLRVILEEKEEMIKVLTTKVDLLKSGVNQETTDTPSAETSLPETEGAEDENINVYKQKVKRLEALLAKCKDTIKSNKDRNSQLAQEKDSLAKSLEERSSELQKIQEKEAEVQAGLRAELHKLREQHDHLKSQQEEMAMAMAETKRNMHEELESKEKHLNQMKDNLQTAKAAAEALEKQVKDANSTLNQRENEFKKVESELREQLQSMEKTLDEEKKASLQELSRGKTAAVNLMQQDCEKKIKEVEDTWTTKWKTCNEEFNTKLSEKEHQLKETLGKLHELKSELKEAEEKIHLAAEERNSANRNNLEQLQSHNHQLSKEVEQLKSEKAVLEDFVTDLRKELQNKSVDHETELKQLKDVIEQEKLSKEESLKELHQRCSELETLKNKDAENSQQQLNNLQKQHEHLLQEKHILEEKVAELERNLSNEILLHKEETEALRMTFCTDKETSLFSVVEEYEKKVRAASEQLDKCLEELKAAQEKYETKAKECQSLEEKFQELERNFNNLVVQHKEETETLSRSLVEDKEASLSAVNQESEHKIQVLNDQLNNALEEIKAMQTNQETTVQEFGSFKAKIKELEQELQEKDTQHKNTIEEEKVTLSKRLKDEYDSMTKALQEDLLKKHEKDLEAKQNELDKLSLKLEEISKKATKLEEQLQENDLIHGEKMKEEKATFDKLRSENEEKLKGIEELLQKHQLESEDINKKYQESLKELSSCKDKIIQLEEEISVKTSKFKSNLEEQKSVIVNNLKEKFNTKLKAIKEKLSQEYQKELSEIQKRHEESLQGSALEVEQLHTAQIAELNQRHKNLLEERLNELQVLQDQNRQLSDQVEKCSEHIQTLEAKESVLLQQVQSLVQQVDESKYLVNLKEVELQKERDNSQNELVQIQEKLKSAHAEIKEAKKVQKQKEEQIKELSGKLQETSQLHLKEIESLQKEILSQKELNDEANYSLRAEMEDKINSLMEEKETVESECRRLSDQNQNLLSQCQDLNSSLDSLNNSSFEYEKKLNNVIADYDTTMQQLHELRQENNSLEHSNNSLKSSLSELKRELDLVEQERASFAEDLKLHQELQSQKRTLENELQSASQELKTLQDVNSELQKSNDSLVEERSALKKDIEVLKNSSAEQVQGLFVELEQFRKEKEKLMEENIRLSEMEQKIEKDFADQVEVYKAKLQEAEELSHKVEEQSAALKEREEKLTALQHEFETTLKELKEKLVAEEERYQCLVNDSASKVDSVESAYKETLKFQEEKASQEIEKLTFEVERLENELKVRSVQLDESLLVAEENTSSMSNQLKDATDRINSLQQQYNELTEEKCHLALELSSALSKNSNLCQHVSELEEQLNILKSSQQDNLGSTDELKAKISELEEALQQRELDFNSKMKTAVHEFSKEMETKDAEHEKSYSAVVEKAENMEGKLRHDHQQEVAALEREIGEKVSAIEEVHEHYQEMLKQKDEELRRLQGQNLNADSQPSSPNNNRNGEAASEHNAWDDEWAKLDESQWNTSSPTHSQTTKTERDQDLLEDQKCEAHLLQIEALQNALAKHQDEISELRYLIGNRQNNNSSSSTAESCVKLPELTEYEYLRNILFKYMMGKEPVTLAKVIAAVLKFSEEQTNQILQREETKLQVPTWR